MVAKDPVKPPLLRLGGKVGIVAPAGCVDADRLNAGIMAIRARGFEVEVGDGVLARKGYLAGDGASRAKDLVKFFQRDDIDAVLCARGGFGSAQILEYLIPELMKRPKIFVGYSDITILINWFMQRYGLVTFHGPMAAMDLAISHSGRTREYLWDVLTGVKSTWRLPLIQVIRPGTARAPLVGGCLSLLITTLGTPYEIDVRHKILFLEDVGEKPYRLERMLNHLKMAGKFENIAGVVLGDFTHCQGGNGRELLDIATELFYNASFPVVMGMPAGHGAENVMLPFGVMMELDGDTGTLAMLESPVA